MGKAVKPSALLAELIRTVQWVPTGRDDWADEWIATGFEAEMSEIEREARRAEKRAVLGDGHV